MTAIKVRHSRKQDAEAIAELTAVLGRWLMKQETRTSADDICRYAFGPDRWCDILIAHDGERILGYALYRYFFEGFTGWWHMYPSDLAFAPDARRGGIGKALEREHLEALAKT